MARPISPARASNREAMQIRWDAGTLASIDRFMSQFPANLVAKEAGKACNKAMAPVLRTARQLVTRRTGLLRKSLGKKQKKYGAKGNIYTIIGPLTGFKDPATGENPVNIAHLVEFGTAPHLIAPKNQSGALAIKRGHGPTAYVDGAVQHPGATAKPFIRPAFDANKNSVLQIVGTELGKGLERQAVALKWPVPK